MNTDNTKLVDKDEQPEDIDEYESFIVDNHIKYEAKLGGGTFAEKLTNALFRWSIKL
jgi:hypothetical protein